MSEAPPLDVRLMNAASLAAFGCAVLVVVSAALVYLVQHPAFALRKLIVTGDTQRNSVPTLRANVLPRLNGNFFTADLQQAQRAFEQVPWVRTASVRRDFPNRLRVQLTEHQAVAFFGTEGDSSMVNSLGEVFVANAADVTDAMPRLVGLESQTKQLWRMYTELEQLFEPLDLSIVQLELSAGGSWRATLDNDALVELGRGEDASVIQTAQRFTQSLTRSSAQIGRTVQDLEYADLRYQSGYSVRLRGISTQTQPFTKP